MSFSNLNEGLGKVLRFGANDRVSDGETQVDGIECLGPAMNAALQQLGGVELTSHHRAGLAYGR